MSGAQGAAQDDIRLRRLERILALARIALALLALFVVQLEPAGVPGDVELLNGLLPAYAAYAGLVALLVALPVPRLASWNAALHWIDVTWALAITSVSSGPASIFFVFFVFVVVGAAYRWGLRETIFTGVVAAVILLAEAVSPLPGMPRAAQGGAGRLVTRCAYVIGLAGLVGYLAEEQNRARRQDALTARILAAVTIAGGFRGSLRGLLVELLDAFAATSAAVAVQNRAGFLYVWSLAGRDLDLQLTTGQPADRDVWGCRLPLPPAAWLIVRRTRGPVVAGAARRQPDGIPPAPLLERLLDGSRRVLVGDVEAGDEWRARVVLHDPRAAGDLRDREWLADVLPRVGSALYSVYLLGRLRERATAAERARIARELHDEVIQTLVGLEMRVDVLKRQAASTPVAGDLGEIQTMLREQAVSTRELMQDIRPVETDGTDVPALLASVAESFRRESGIDARFACDLEDPVVPPRLARELVRVAREALVNVRRHSKAGQVLLEFGATPDAWVLIVDDDGRGFDLDGTFSLEDLDRQHRGPLVIKQRVRAMGGTLTMTTSPGRGARLEVTVPRKTR